MGEAGGRRRKREGEEKGRQGDAEERKEKDEVRKKGEEMKKKKDTFFPETTFLSRLQFPASPGRDSKRQVIKIIVFPCLDWR